MADYNKVILIGRLTRDPKTAEGGNAAFLSVAVNRQWRGKDGQKQEATDFLDCVAFGKTVELVMTYLHKASTVLIEGRLSTYTRENDGQKQSTVQVVIERLQFLDPPRGNRASSGQSQQAAEPPVETDDIPY